jgi:hypothetical protein
MGLLVELHLSICRVSHPQLKTVVISTYFFISSYFDNIYLDQY